MNKPRNPATGGWLPDNVWRLAVGRITCPVCRALPGRECVVRGTIRLAKETHWGRVEPLAVAWQMGKDS